MIISAVNGRCPSPYSPVLQNRSVPSMPANSTSRRRCNFPVTPPAGVVFSACNQAAGLFVQGGCAQPHLVQQRMYLTVSSFSFRLKGIDLFIHFERLSERGFDKGCKRFRISFQSIGGEGAKSILLGFAWVCSTNFCCSDRR